MRPIKFRAWDGVKMFMPALFHQNGNGLFAERTSGGVFEGDTNPIVLMQYTGLHDKNGKEIYEGDVVRKWNNTKPLNDYSDGKAKRVHWTPSNCGFNLRKPFHHKNGVLTWEYEVIGNIYEHSHLLQGQGSRGNI